MCNKLFAVLLVLGLVSSAMAVDADNIQIQYTMDNSMAGFQMNSATGAASLGPIGMGVERFLAAHKGYTGDAMFGDALILSNDGPLSGPNNVWCGSSWCLPVYEAGNIIDITPEVESMEPEMKPFENKTISFWFKQTAQIDPSLHHPDFDGTEYLFGSYFTYSTFIALNAGAEGGPDVLGFRAGASGTVLGKDDSETGGNTRSDWYYADIEMNEWYHVALVLKNTAGDPTHDMEASFYVNGELLAVVGGLTRDSDSWYWDAPKPWNLAAIGGYQQIEDGTTGHCTGVLVDDFGILNVPACGAVIKDIYEMGLEGKDLSYVPEPGTLLLLGLGAMMLRRKRRA